MANDKPKKIDDKTKKPKNKSKKSIAKFFREVSSELKKVSWPSMKELTNYTGVVVAFLIISAAVIGVFDYVVVVLLRPLLNH